VSARSGTRGDPGTKDLARTTFPEHPTETLESSYGPSGTATWTSAPAGSHWEWSDLCLYQLQNRGGSAVQQDITISSNKIRLPTTSPLKAILFILKGGQLISCIKYYHTFDVKPSVYLNKKIQRHRKEIINLLRYWTCNVAPPAKGSWKNFNGRESLQSLYPNVNTYSLSVKLCKK